jgi:hypothetical protein
MNGDEIEKLTDPASYLGVTDAFIDRALADVAGLNIKV